MLDRVYKWRCIAKYLIRNITDEWHRAAKVSCTTRDKTRESSSPLWLLPSKQLSPSNANIVPPEGSAEDPLNQSSFFTAATREYQRRIYPLLVRHKSAAGLPANQAQSLRLDSSIGALTSWLCRHRGRERERAIRAIDRWINKPRGWKRVYSHSHPSLCFPLFLFSVSLFFAVRGARAHVGVMYTRRTGRREPIERGNPRHILSRIIYRHGVQALDLI